MAEDIIQRASILFSRGEKKAAQELLNLMIQQDPSNVNAWYGMSFCAEDPEQKKMCLRRILEIKPGEPRVRALLDDLEAGKLYPLSPNLAKKQAEISIQTDSLLNPTQPTVRVRVEPVRLRKNKAGQSTREMSKERWNASLLIAIVIIGMGAIFCFIVLPLVLLTKLGIFAMILIFALFAGFVRYGDQILGKEINESRRATRGAIAEEQVGNLLDYLGDDYTVLHDVTSKYGNIDHIVLSRAGGIFLIETKSHRGKISVENGKVLLNGHYPEKDLIAQVLRNLFWLRETLQPLIGTKAWITPILVFTNAFVPYTSPVKGVRVLNQRFLISTIESNSKNNAACASMWGKRDEIIRLLS